METDETLPATPKRSAQEKHETLKNAIELLRTVNFNSLRKGLNAELKALEPVQKHKLFRELASNLPLEWCKKFSNEEFLFYRLEYMEDLDLEEEKFNELDAQQYLDRDKCCGNFRMLVCLNSDKNDDKNASLPEDSYG